MNLFIYSKLLKNKLYFWINLIFKCDVLFKSKQKKQRIKLFFDLI